MGIKENRDAKLAEFRPELSLPLYTICILSSEILNKDSFGSSLGSYTFSYWSKEGKVLSSSPQNVSHLQLSREDRAAKGATHGLLSTRETGRVPPRPCPPLCREHCVPPRRGLKVRRLGHRCTHHWLQRAEWIGMCMHKMGDGIVEQKGFEIVWRKRRVWTKLNRA